MYDPHSREFRESLDRHLTREPDWREDNRDEDDDSDDETWNNEYDWEGELDERS